MGSDHLKETTAMTIEARSDREMQLASQVAELKRELAELREALARTSQVRQDILIMGDAGRAAAEELVYRRRAVRAFG